MPSMFSDLHKKTNGFTVFVAEDIPTEDGLSDTITEMDNHCMIYIGSYL
jgi:hypothetical protein